jgi:hypothetical protein
LKHRLSRIDREQVATLVLVAGAWVLLPVSELLVRTVRFDILTGFLKRVRGRAAAVDCDPLYQERIERIVQFAARGHLWEMTCLRRAIATFLLLRLAGYGCNLRIGVRKDDAGFQAHAWIGKFKDDGSSGIFRELLIID